MTMALSIVLEQDDLATLAVEIRAEHEACEGDARSAVEHAVNAGALLTVAKAQVQHGAWLPWLAENFPAHHNTAAVYMKLAANSQRVVNLESVRAGLRELAKPAAPSKKKPKKKPDPDEGPSHYLPDVLDGSDPDGELRELIVQWCYQERRITELLTSGAKVATRLPEDRAVLTDGLGRITATAKKMKERLNGV